MRTAEKSTVNGWARLAFAFWLAVLPGHGLAAETLRLVTGNDFRPFSDQGLPEGGLATEVVEKAFASQGVALELDWQDWQRGYEAAKLLRYAGTFPYYTSEARAADFLYSQPLYAVKRRLFFRADRSPAPERVEAIEGGTVCRAQGYTPHAPVEALVQAGKVRLEQPLDMTRCFELLALGRVDFVEADELQGWEAAGASAQLGPEAVRASAFVTEESGLHLIVPKRLEGAERIVGLFNAGLAAITADGTYAAILRRHLGEAGAGPAAQAAAEPSDLLGKAVALVMQDGTRLKGTIEALEGGSYRLRTAYGTLGLPTAQVAELHEEGAAAAPAAAPAPAAGPVAAAGARQAALRLAGPPGGTLLPALVEAFVAARGEGELEWQVGDPARRVARLPGARPGALREIEVVSLGPAEAFRSLAAGSADAGLVERAALPEELAATRRLGDLAGEAGQQVVALDALVAVTHPANRLPRVSRATLGRILAGEIRAWSELGGPATPIEVMSPSPRASAFQLVREALLQGRPLAPGARILSSDAEIARMVASFEGAIGIVRAAQAGKARPLPIDECGVTYDPTDPFTVATEEWPLTRRLHLYGPPASPHPALGAFAAFATSAAAQPAILEAGYVGLEPRRESEAGHARLLARLDAYRPQAPATLAAYRALARDGRRLSATIRFESGSHALDARGARDVRRLAAFVRAERLEPARLVLAGFSDGRGERQANLRLAEARAADVAAALAREGVAVGAVLGLGEELPVACGGDERGWARNRRVEVWVR